MPPTFGAFTRRVYASENPLIGYPLAYQYLTSLRADALPLNANELLAMRGRGWLSSYSIGNPVPANGLPLASGFRWDTGVQVHAAGELVDATVSVTTGTLSNPLFRDDNSGRQIAARLSARPIAGPHPRRVGRARAVRQRDGGARRRRRRPGRRVHADGLGRRRRVLARLLPRAR